MPCEDGGGSWSRGAANGGAPRISSKHQKVRERHRTASPLQPSDQAWRWHTLICVSFKPCQFGEVCYSTLRKLINHSEQATDSTQPYQNSQHLFFAANGKTNPRIHMELQRVRQLAKTTLQKKNTIGRFIHTSWFENVTTELQSSKQCGIGRRTDWQNKDTSPERNPYTHGQVILDKSTKTIQCGKNSLFIKRCWYST